MDQAAESALRSYNLDLRSAHLHGQFSLDKMLTISGRDCIGKSGVKIYVTILTMKRLTGQSRTLHKCARYMREIFMRRCQKERSVRQIEDRMAKVKAAGGRQAGVELIL